MTTEKFTAYIYRSPGGRLISQTYTVDMPGWDLVATKEVEVEIPATTADQAAAQLLEKAAAIEAKAEEEVADLLAQAKQIMSANNE